MKKRQKLKLTKSRRRFKDLNIQKLNMVKKPTTIGMSNINSEIRKARRIIRKETDHITGNHKERVRSNMRLARVKNLKEYLKRSSNPPTTAQLVKVEDLNSVTQERLQKKFLRKYQ